MLDRRTRPSATSPSARCCCCAVARRLPAACASCCRAPGSRNQHRGRARAARATGSSEGTEGLIALSGARGGDVGQALLAGNAERAERARASAGRELFPRPLLHRAAARRAARRRGARRARGRARRAARRCRWWRRIRCSSSSRDDFKAHEARVCIAEGDDARRPAPAAALHAPSSTSSRRREMARAVRRPAGGARELGRDRAALQPTLELGKPQLPAFPTPDGHDRSTSYLRAESHDGPGAAARAAVSGRGRARDAARALRASASSSRSTTIVQDGLPGYFLIVADFINWAQEQRRARSARAAARAPARWSPTALGITDLDPLRYDLLFERFLNPERVSMPDFDIDFCQDGRDRVIEYVQGQVRRATRVSQIATFGTMAAKAVVRDVGRVLDLGYSFCDQHREADPVQAGQARSRSPTRARWSRCSPSARRTRTRCTSCSSSAQQARRPDAQRRHARRRRADRAGQAHRLLPAVRAARRRQRRSSQFDKDDVEAVGLVKFDFLGLTR